VALKQAFTTKTGIELPAAYVRIVKVELDYRAETAAITVVRYASQEARDSGAKDMAHDKDYYEVEDAEFHTLFGDVVLAAQDKTPLSIAYGYLKTRPAYANAIDVIEVKP